MDSTLTLVNPTPQKTLYFHPNSMKNTTIYAGPSNPVYTVTTDKENKHTVLKVAGTENVVATFERRDLFPDLITFSQQNEGAATSVHKWLKKSKLPDGYPVHVMETTFGPYIWKYDARFRQGLYLQNNLEKPEAYFQSASETTPAALVMELHLESLKDEVILALLILEQRMRMQEKFADVADGKVSIDRYKFGKNGA